MPNDITTPVVVALITLVGTAITTWGILRQQRRKQPIEESTAAYANAKVLSDASADWVTAVRADLKTTTERIGRLEDEIAAMRAENAELRRENVRLRIENAELRDDVAALRTQLGR